MIYVVILLSVLGYNYGNINAEARAKFLTVYNAF